MNKKHLTPAEHPERLHVRINQIEVVASGRFTIVIVVIAILLANLIL